MRYRADTNEICAVCVLYIQEPIFVRIKKIADALKREPDKMLEEVVEGIFTQGSAFNFKRYLEALKEEPSVEQIKFFKILTADEVSVMLYLKAEPRLIPQVQTQMPPYLGTAANFIRKLEELGFKIERRFDKHLMEFYFRVVRYPKEP